MDTSIRTSRRKGERTRVWGIVAILTLFASIVVAAPVGADHEDVVLPPGVTIINERPNGKVIFESTQGRVYDDQVRSDGEPAQWLAIGGGSLIDICVDTGFPPVPLLYLERPNGAYIGKTLAGGIEMEVHVYKTDLNVPDFFDSACGGFFGQGTPMPAAFASGFATMTEKVRVRDLSAWMDDLTPQPPGRYLNGLEGVVADADGNAYDLVTVADLRVKANGAPLFNEISVNLTPKA
jgi:hypothetical protein